MDSSKMRLDEITDVYNSKADAALEAIGVSAAVTISQNTAKMLQIKKAINFLYGRFESIYLQSFAVVTNELEDESVAPLIALENAMWKMIVDVMDDNNADAFEVKL